GQTWEGDAAKDSLWTLGTFVTNSQCGHSLGLKHNGIDSNRVSDWIDFPRPTPGYSNNPPPYDVALTGLAADPAAAPAQRPFALVAAIASRGASAARHVSLTVFSDDDRDSLADAGETVYARLALDTLAGACSLRCAMPGLEEGVAAIAVAAACSSDAYRWDNYAALALTVGSPVVVNEIMYDPAPGLAEWVELYNRSASPADIYHFTVEDLSGAAKVIDTAHTVLVPHGYAVLTSKAGQPSVTCPLLKPVGGLPSLNNDGDLVCLRDAGGAVVDEVSYDAHWGGGCGVSLERINPFLASSDRASWGGCVSSACATPGAQNSLYQEKPAAGPALALSPNPFSPDRDGYEDNLIISLALDWPQAAVTVRVYDRLGRLVRTLAQDKPTAASADLVWDGTSDQGTVCPMGLYVVSLEARAIVSGGAIKTSKVVAIARKL
ncbi:MAG TPA: lamin tail domain-containing protein, partial [Candidatus Edwardsbacteria bacterium]|nr:lamin tail domain-containing protein [Candidatus Edwardsbacteria bacterium]